MSCCAVCGQSGADCHHIKTRGAGGTDDDYNIIYLCRKHHTEAHYGCFSFAKKYRLLEQFRKAKGERKYQQWLKTQQRS